MSTVYDILYRPVRLDKPLKDKAAEALAQAIMLSGRLRLDADFEANFTRLTIPGGRINHAFSIRELFDPKLAPRTSETLTRLLAQGRPAEAVREQVATYLERLRADIQKRAVVPAEMELKMARALVSCNAYPVIRLIYLEGVEIFISYGHSVGDVMDVATWQEHGRNSGMQAAGGGENAVYVSCGGNPFLYGNERRHTGDGYPALARFMIIAAQETGHNADIIRNEHGVHIGRYSAAGWSRAPSEKAGAARRNDSVRLSAMFRRAQESGLNRVCEWERQLKFYRDNRLTTWRTHMAWLLARIGWQVVKRLLRRRGVTAVLRIQKSAYPATLARTFFRDMLFNVAPVADVYKRENAQEEEAILCIEALARVPQQAVKWGHEAVQNGTPALYALYYNEVVPACQRACARFDKR